MHQLVNTRRSRPVDPRRYRNPMADRPDRGRRRSEVPLPPMPAAWREPAEDPEPSRPYPPPILRSAEPPPPRPPEMRSPIVQPPGLYGTPPPLSIRPKYAGTAAIPVSGPRTRPVSAPRPRPVSGPRARPISPIAYPGLPASAPPVPAVADAAEVAVHPLTGEPLSDRSGVVAGVLQLVLGWVGAGRLYTGHVAIALAQLGVVWMVALLMTCGLGGGPEFLALGWLGFTWPAVDGILLLCGGQRDSQGRRLR